MPQSFSNLLKQLFRQTNGFLFSFPSKLFNELYKNNASRSETSEKKHNQNYFMEMITVDGVYDYLMYVGKCSLYLHSIYLSILKFYISVFYILSILKALSCHYQAE